jgi:hypothetical protein
VGRAARSEEEKAMACLDLPLAGKYYYNRRVLERLEVPPGAIRDLHPPVKNTADEVRLVARELQRVGGDGLILVTSKPHSRRVRVTWRALAPPALHATVRYATEDAHDRS